VIGILAVQEGRLDTTTLRAVASDLDLSELLERAFAEANQSRSP
jgi:hypothetical protein